MNSSLLRPIVDALAADPASRVLHERLDVVTQSGRRYGFSYKDLVWVDYDPAGLRDEAAASFRDRKHLHLRLNFATHTVNVTGSGLATVYLSLLRQELSELRPEDERYRLDGDDESPRVTGVFVLQKSGSFGGPAAKVEPEGGPSE